MIVLNKQLARLIGLRAVIDNLTLSELQQPINRMSERDYEDVYANEETNYRKDQVYVRRS